MSDLKSKMIFNVNRTGLQLKKHLPSILTVLGIGGTIVSTVLACRATLKLEDTLDEVKEDINTVKEVKDEIDENDYKKELAKSYVKATGKVSHLYLPAATLGILSVSCIIGSHNILKNRNAALIAAYTLVEGSFAKYRERVVEEFGEEKDKEIHYGIKKETIEVEDPNKKGKKKKEEVLTIDKEYVKDYSPYARFFDEYNPNWDRSAEYNLLFLNTAQKYANQKLRASGHLFLNEVYDTLGIKRSKEGAIVGWIYDPMDANSGDNFVNFGIYDISSERSRAFVNGYEMSILLDFNVDGIIYDKI